MVNLGEKVKKLRIERHLTQAEVAHRIGVSKAMISSYEIDSRAPSYEILVKIASFFNVSTDYLLGLEKTRSINADGLTDLEIAAIINMIEVLRNR